VAQEHLLERGWCGDDPAGADRSEASKHRIEPVRVDLTPHPGALHLQAVHARKTGEAVGRAAELSGERRPGEVAQLGKRAGLDHAAAPNDRDVITERLDLGEDVAGQQHGPAGRSSLGDAGLEGRLHQRIQPRGRFVEDQQFRLGCERRDQDDLLPVPGGVGAGLLRRVQLEPLDQLGPPARVGAAPHAGEQVDHLAAGQVRPERHVAGHVGQPAMQCRRVGPRIAPEDLDMPCGRAHQAQEDADRRRLAGAVRTEEAVYLPHRHRQIQPIQRPHPSERLHQTVHRDGITHHRRPLRASPRPIGGRRRPASRGTPTSPRTCRRCRGRSGEHAHGRAR